MIFEDRISAYPGRYKLTDESGNVSYVTLTRADEPVVEGTPLNANSFTQMQEELITNSKNAITAVGVNGGAVPINGMSFGFQFTRNSDNNPNQAIPLTLLIATTRGYIGTIQIAISSNNGEPRSTYFVCDNTVPVESVTYSDSNGGPGCAYMVKFTTSVGTLVGSAMLIWPNAINLSNGVKNIDLVMAPNNESDADQPMTRYVEAASL